MTINIMDEYINLTEKQINTYMRLIFGKKFNKNYCDFFVQKYINIRYFNYYENEVSATVRKKILEALKQQAENMIINNINDRELIETMRMFFNYVLYFDNVVYYKDLRKKVEQITKLKGKILGNNNSEELEEILYKKMKEYIGKKEDLINRFDSDEFFIKLTRYKDKKRVFRVNLKFNLKFPPEYSEFAINKAFETGVINEDKLIIEYYLTTIQIIRDILKQDFQKKYIVEFADTLLKKNKKIKSLLNIINNSAIQEKISLKIKYEHFTENKEYIYELMRSGYKITIILDNSFNPNYKDIESLRMFEFVIVNPNLKHYEEFMENKGTLQNIIEI